MSDSNEPDKTKPVHLVDNNIRPGTTDQLKTGSTLTTRYQIESVLGVGGMGAVYRARDLHFPNVIKHVAVKEMFIQTVDPVVRGSIVRNFEREANLLATLDHPAIPRIYDYFTSHNRSYLILEFINGKNLETMLEDEYSAEQVVQWAIEICDVLSYLHNHQPDPIIFRDMKPSNVMINQYGKVVLVDFGIAKPFRGDQKGTMIGTEGYAPPEQYRGEASQLADIYSLGATLHHMLTKQDPRLEPPFSFGERPIRAVNPRVIPELEEIIQQSLQYIPEDRFMSAQEMKQALLGILPLYGIKIELSSPAAITSSQAVEPTWIFTCDDEIRGTPSVQDGVLYFGSYDKNLYALDCETGELKWKYPTDGAIVTKPLVVEDNVYFGSEDNRLHVVNARTGKISWSHYTNGSIWSSPALSAGHIFIGSEDGCIHAINISNARLVWKMEAGAVIRSTPLIYEDGIYFGSQSGDYFCLDFRGAIHWRFKARRAITSSSVAAKNTVFFGSVDSTLYALDAKSGWVIWRFRLGKGTISSPVVRNEFIYIGSIDGNLYCIDTRTAKEIWRFPTQHQVTGSPVIAGDNLYFGSVDNYLYCLDPQDGFLRWKYQTGGPITGTPQVNNNTIYVGSTDGKLYALPATLK